MQLIKQPKGIHCCGQCCLAMLANITLEEAIKLIGHNGTTRDWELISLYNNLVPESDMEIDFCYYGEPTINHSKLTLLQLHINPHNPQQKHWTILKDFQLFDPAEIGDKIWPVYKYWVIK